MKRIRVLLVVLRYKGYRPLIPIGTLYIAHSLREHNIDYKILDLNFHLDSKKVFLEMLKEYAPTYIGISIRNIAETKGQDSIYGEIKDIVSIGKKYAKVILGGAGFSLFAKSLMEYTKADYGIIGPGEVEFIKYIQLCEKVQSNAYIDSSDIAVEFDKISIGLEIVQYWNHYGRYHRLLDTEIPIQRIRGCQLCCAYCCYPGLNAMKLQYRDINFIIDEVDYLYRKLKVNLFYFVDAAFNMSLAYTKEFLKRWYEKFRNYLKWRCCINPACFDMELLQLMKECGCIECELGIDSCNDTVLTRMNKTYKKSDIISLLSAIERVGLSYTVSLILGGEGETEESLKDTVACLEKFRPISVTAFCGVRIYPSTTYSQRTMREESELFYAEPSSFFISQDAITELQKIVQKAPERWYMVNTEVITSQES